MTDIRVKFFARLREQLGTAEVTVPVEHAPTLNALIDWLESERPQWRAALQAPLLRAVNQDMASGNPALAAGDEVALFPPVTGG